MQKYSKKTYINIQQCYNYECTARMKNLLINLSVKPIWATFFKIKEIIKNCKKSWGEH